MTSELIDIKKKLKETEQKFKVLFNNSTSGIAYHKIVYDKNGKHIDYIITDVNPEYEKILLFRKDKFLNKRVTEIYPLEKAPYIDIFAKVADTQESISFEAYFAPLDTHFKFSVMSPKKGEFITVVDNITDKKKAEEALKLEKDKLQAFMDGLTISGIGIDIVNKDYEVLFQNEILKEKFGDLSGESCYEKYMGLEEPCKFCPMKRAIETKSVERVELKGADGRIYELTSAPLLNLDGTVNKAAEIVIDISERILAEKELKESEEKYRDLFNKAPIGIFLFDENGFLIDGNITVSNTFSGFPISESKGKHFTQIIPLFKNDKELLNIFIQRAKDQKMGKDLNPIEFKVIRKDGRERWLHWQSSKINLQDKSITQVVIQEITERKEAEQLIIEENKKLQELNEMRQELITRISHELKTPLTSIHGAAQALIEIHKEDMNENILEFVKMINRGGIRLKTLVENLIDVSKLGAKKIDITPQKENLVNIISEHVEDLKYFADIRNIKIISNLPSELFLHVDKFRIGQVISNLLSNAINNTLPGGQVTISIEESDVYVDIKIEDTGIGITESEKRKLFEKFGKIERFGKGYDVHIEGSGLGLYISKEFVELHGGKILVESEGRNMGAIFTVRLNKEKVN